MEPTAADLLKLYALLLDTVSHGTLDDLKSILAATPRSVVAQLNYSGETRTAILNSAIVRRYYQLYDKLDYDNTVEVPAGRDLPRRKQFYDAVKLLLDHGFGPDDIGPGEDDYGPAAISPVQLAAETDDSKILQLLLDAGADPKSHYSDSTGPSSSFDVSGPPLQSAAANGSLAALECLISWSKQHPGSFQLSEGDRADALLASAHYIFPDALQVLLSSFAFSKDILSKALDVAVASSIIDTEFSSRFPVVHRGGDDIWQAQIKTAQKLLNAGADANHTTDRGHRVLDIAARTAKGPDIVRLLIDHGARVDQGVEELFLSALRNGNTDLVRTFLDLGLIPSQFSPDGVVSCTALHLAATHAPVDTLKLLVSAGLDPSARDTNGWTVFHYACKACCVENLSYLLSLDPHAIHQPTPDGWTPLTIGYKADAKYYEDGAAYLVEQGADINTPTPETPKYTPVHIAAKEGYWDLLNLLLEQEALITQAEGTGESPLHFMDWDDEVHSGTKTLLKHGADINAQDGEGSTLLHKLFKVDPRRYYKDIVRFLLESGADLSIRDKQGKTPKDWNDELPEFRRWRSSEWPGVQL
ncbi:ankyrin repeat-containing domain protein [Aspergillus carlsbadensis]|nr:ankyrin repeat-containing domain protein [Aspergillus carlsbadensis]